jgi:hypothetical protein
MDFIQSHGAPTLMHSQHTSRRERLVDVDAKVDFVPSSEWIGEDNRASNNIIPPILSEAELSRHIRPMQDQPKGNHTGQIR